MRMGSPLHSEPTDLWLLSLPHFIMLSDTGQRKWPRPVPCYQILHISIRMSLFPRRHCGFLEFGLDVPHVVVELLSNVWLFATPWTTARQGSLSFTISQSLLKLMSVELVMSSNQLILYHPLLHLSRIFLRIFSNMSTLCIRWPKYWNFSFSISPSNEYSGLISLRIDWFDLLDFQRNLKNLLQHHSSKMILLWLRVGTR